MQELQQPNGMNGTCLLEGAVTTMLDASHEKSDSGGVPPCLKKLFISAIAENVIVMTKASVVVVPSFVSDSSWHSTDPRFVRDRNMVVQMSAVICTWYAKTVMNVSTAGCVPDNPSQHRTTVGLPYTGADRWPLNHTRMLPVGAVPEYVNTNRRAKSYWFVVRGLSPNMHMPAK